MKAITMYESYDGKFTGTETEVNAYNMKHNIDPFAVLYTTALLDQYPELKDRPQTVSQRVNAFRQGLDAMQEMGYTLQAMPDIE